MLSLFRVPSAFLFLNGREKKKTEKKRRKKENNKKTAVASLLSSSKLNFKQRKMLRCTRGSRQGVHALVTYR
jgi:hypothetical protein